MKLLAYTLVGTLTLLCGANESHAEEFKGIFEENTMAVGAVAGTNGIGIELQKQVSDSWVLRGGPNYFSYDYDDEIDDVDYDLEAEFANLGLIVDYHPFSKSGWHVSGGLSFGATEVDLTARPNGNVNIGGTSFTPAQVGTLRGNVENSDVAPYLGIGYNNTFTNSGNWSFRANAGVLFAGQPDVSLRADGQFANNATLQAELREEEREIEKELDFLEYYPVVTVGLGYRF